jgi:hypothetical protein
MASLVGVLRGIERHTPGAKAPVFGWGERPKAKALGYLEAMVFWVCDDGGRSRFPSGMTRKNGKGNGKCKSKGNCNCNCRSRSLRDDKQKGKGNCNDRSRSLRDDKQKGNCNGDGKNDGVILEVLRQSR